MLNLFKEAKDVPDPARAYPGVWMPSIDPAREDEKHVYLVVGTNNLGAA